MRVLGVDAIYHDPSAVTVVDGTVAAAPEEERFSRRTHGKRPVAYSRSTPRRASRRRSSASTTRGTTCAPRTRSAHPSSWPRRCPGWTRPG